MALRCRLCANNDRDSLVEDLAQRMWDARRDREIDPDWDNAGPYWQEAIRLFASETIAMLSDG
ncbi:hypothetical protein [Novosphingobium sp. JCM 18896]|uniref:hypothetical protein n=1 Tax=Novosphingobium sp. JCM 18896 TaxID=2989731 RepID=UPI002223C0BA|nr:hypothetical protein [Novosphingobium sp. JCM 18896]MCW1432499.1 hypothetical protein [Novosphingobium sp. JCM 18896]